MSARRKIMWIAITVVLILCLPYLFPTDSTDKSRWSRSGMRLHIDHKTGLHYLSTGRTLIPRLDENGNHMRGHE